MGHYSIMYVLNVSILFTLLAMAPIIQAGPAQTRAKVGCYDYLPSWCYNTFKDPKINLCVQSYSEYCHRTCGNCDPDYDPATATDPCDCDGVRCKKAHDCNYNKPYKH